MANRPPPMALKILESCINCDVCEPACPQEAISFCDEDVLYTINPDKCTECQGDYDLPQCQSLCPVSGCIIKR